MKRILITGVNSYIGNSFKEWLKPYSDEYLVHNISLKSGDWKQTSFSNYDVILHVAGIAHISTKHKMEGIYYNVNRDLTIELAKKAKTEGVKQFIFTSSIIVYGDSRINKKMIDKTTPPNPSDFYGNSKLQAEKGIEALEEDNFKVVILRLPMIYGENSKGNYRKLSKLAQITPIFPEINNKRSVLHIDNLCEFIRLLINNEERGLFFPQNSEYVKVSDMVKLISEVHGKKLRLTKAFNPILRLLGLKFGIIHKVFGDQVYDQSLSIYKEDYRIRDFRTSIILSEKGRKKC
jgi:UDP-glucose 4-epimerase